MKKLYTLVVMAFIAIAVNAQSTLVPLTIAPKQRVNASSGILFGNNTFNQQWTKRAKSLVTPPSGLTPVAYTLEGTFMQYNGSEFESVDGASPADAAVIIDGKNIYIQGLSHFFPESWVKGTISGNTVVIPSGQYVGASGGNEVYINGDDDNNPNESEDAVDIIFEYNSSTGELTELETGYILESPYANSRICYAFWYYVSLTKEDGEVPEVVTPPLGLKTDVWTLSAQDVTFENEQPVYTPVSGEVNIGFKGNDVYVQGMNPYIPDAWIKGTRSGNAVTFETGQYYGAFTYEGHPYDMYFVGYSQSGVSDVEFTINNTENEMSSDEMILVNGKKKSIDYYNIFVGMTLKKDASDGISTIKAEKTDGAIYSIDGRRLNEVPATGLYIQNGKKYVVK